MTRPFLLACLFLHAVLALAQGSLEVVPLKHRSAEQVIPVLRALVEPGGVITGQGYQLFVRTTPANFDELRRALASIDTPQRRLLISVRFENASDASREAVAAGVTLRPGASQVEARASAARGTIDERIDQRVQALEGARALISTGQSRPLRERQVFSGPGGGFVRETTVIQSADTGFEVTPRLSGNTVFLEIHPQRETLGASGTMQSQRVSSTVSAPLGAWIELGSAAETSAGTSSAILAARDARRTETRGVWVRVEELRP